jgi:hypothetical protein
MRGEGMRSEEVRTGVLSMGRAVMPSSLTSPSIHIQAKQSS